LLILKSQIKIMGKKDPKIDAYIARSADFAKPILKHIRNLIHKGCPEVAEKIKWSFPNFEYKGIFCNMAAFKAHCTFGFWQGALIKDNHGVLTSGEAMGHFGKITSLKDLPSDKIILDYIHQAVRLKDEGIKNPKKTVKRLKEVRVPSEILKIIRANKKAFSVLENFSNSNKKDYIEWIEEAKTETTREKRISTMMEWLQEGKPRNWKYMP